MATKGPYLCGPTCLNTAQGSLLVLLSDMWPFEVWLMDFIQLPQSHVHKYSLVTVQTEDLPCRQATGSSINKVLMEEMILTCGTPLELHSDQGIHFISQVLGKVYTICPILQHSYCASQPQTSGLFYCTKGIIKTLWEKFLEALQIPNPKTLPLVFLNLRFTPFGTQTLTVWDSHRMLNTLGSFFF